MESPPAAALPNFKCLEATCGFTATTLDSTDVRHFIVAGSRDGWASPGCKLTPVYGSSNDQLWLHTTTVWYLDQKNKSTRFGSEIEHFFFKRNRRINYNPETISVLQGRLVGAIPRRVALPSHLHLQQTCLPS